MFSYAYLAERELAQREKRRRYFMEYYNRGVTPPKPSAPPPPASAPIVPIRIEKRPLAA